MQKNKYVKRGKSIKKQQGGGWFDGWFGTTAAPATQPSTGNMFGAITTGLSNTGESIEQGANSINDTLGNWGQQGTQYATDTYNKAKRDTVSTMENVLAPSSAPVAPVAPIQEPQTFEGGKRRRKMTNKRGGYSTGSPIYATRVLPPLDVAKPTYWLNYPKFYQGGKKATKRHKKRAKKQVKRRTTRRF